jgi:RND family efflux transporter MFP subunit
MNSIHARFTIAMFALFAMGGLTGCSSELQPALPPAQTVRNLAVLAVQPANVADLMEAVGTVRAAQTSTLASQIMGNIVEIRVREGDRVQRGQVLAVIDDSQPRAALDRATAADSAVQQQFVAAESDLWLAESTLQRYQILYQRKSVSPQEFDEVKAHQQAARARRDMAQADQARMKAELAEARTALDYTRIRSPFDGVVTEKRIDPGTLASPGVPIFTVEDVHRYRLEAAINESDLRYLRTGQQVPVVIDAFGNTELPGRVVQIMPAADAASRSFLVKIELTADTRLRSGLFGRAHFSRGERTSLLIPRTAVIEHGQLQGVFVLDQNKVATLRYVTLGKSSGEDVEILAGLQGGERFVAKPGQLDLTGKRIEAEP